MATFDLASQIIPLYTKACGWTEGITMDGSGRGRAVNSPDGGRKIAVFDLQGTLVDGLDPIPGMVGLVQSLSEDGWHLYLLSKNPRRLAQKLMTHFGRLIPESNWRTGLDIPARRTEELETLIKAGTGPDRLVYVDDRVENLLAAGAIEQVEIIGFSGGGAKNPEQSPRSGERRILWLKDAANIAQYLNVELPEKNEWPTVDELETQIKKIASAPVSILFYGETGVGKGYYAEKVHVAHQGNHKCDMINVNCSCLTPNLADSMLFGHAKGAFTGAIYDSPGLIKKAENGVLFLDEIGRLPPECHGKLLRFLQEQADKTHEISPLGKTPYNIKVRILAATNSPESLPDDFLERFDFHIGIPPLRKRRADIPKLAADFFKGFQATHGKQAMRFPEAERAKLAADEFPWKGNIRQLEKAVQRAMLECHRLVSGHNEIWAEDIINAANQSLLSK